MASLLTASKRLLLLGLLCISPLAVWAQTFAPQGAEYSLGALPGDQVFSSVDLTPNGGYVVWEDSVIDGNGRGIGAFALDANFSPRFGAFRVNQRTAGNQEKPRVAVFKTGAAAIVWESGGQKFRNICARFLNPAGTFTTTNDIRLNGSTNTDQITPAVTFMTNGNAFVVWSSWNYSVSNMFMQDIRAQIVKTNGALVGTNFYVNGTSLTAPTEQFNQRSPAVATLANGNIVVAWVSENQTQPGDPYYTNWFHIYARLFNPGGVALGPEFRVNTDLVTMCANPAVGGTSDGGFTVAWSQQPLRRVPEGWDVYARTFAADGTAGNPAARVNTYTFGDQYGPRVSRVGDDQMIVWSSLGQDGSWEGVYAQFFASGVPFGAEFRVNTTTPSRQVYPAVASDGAGRFLVTWSSFVSGNSSDLPHFDLFAQRYAAGQPLPVPSAPFVTALSQYSLGVTWPELAGFPLSAYEVYQDGSPTATATVTSNMWVATGLAPGTTHSFQLAFVLAGGQRSPLSPAGSNTTWGLDLSGQFGTPDGLPDDWQRLYFGTKTSDWDSPNVDSDGDGASNWQEFLAGTNPRDPNSVFKQWMTHTLKGQVLAWSTVAGCVYQVQVTTDFQNWASYGPPRFAAGSGDSLTLPGGQTGSYYRVTRVQ